ncbi:hypothetical protein NE237_020951 [Protea cynaroides]|uniref:Phytocyanin domain-containing protein n=1 Tax=Protea cynaroides TaxID=273540 RepID=A0A9Q0H6Y2_9MAGN|nr:hypothetical protein NE237_020951 [Protea cynaroides]
MASNIIMMASCKLLLYLILLSSIHLFLVDSHEYQIDWDVPSSKEPNYYNLWAADQRFLVDDSIHFKYEKDSLLVVTKEEYEKCHSSHPIFFSNNGDTTFMLDQPGLFYFISGISGHCERRQRMIVKVLELSKPPPPAGHNGTNGPSDHSVGVKIIAAPITVPLLMSAMVALFRWF